MLLSYQGTLLDHTLPLPISLDNRVVSLDQKQREAVEVIHYNQPVALQCLVSIACDVILNSFFVSRQPPCPS